MKQNAIQISMINNSNNSNQRLKEIRLLACDEEVLDEAARLSNG